MNSETKKKGLLARAGMFFTDRDKLEPAFVTLLAVIFSLLAGIALIFIVSKSPVKSVTNFLLAPFLKTYNFYYMMILMVPLMFTGLALCIVYQAKYMSLIVDSCFYIGAVVATWIGVSWRLPAGVHPAVAMLVSGLVGGFIGLLPAILKIKWRANELVSSLMFNYVFYFLGAAASSTSSVIRSSRSCPPCPSATPSPCPSSCPTPSSTRASSSRRSS